MLTFTLGTFAIALNHLLLISALALATFVGWRVAKRGGDNPESALFSLFLLGMLAARIAFVLMYWSHYRNDPWQIIDLRDGGFLAWPGVIVLLLAALYRGWRRPGLRRPLGFGVASGVVFWLLATLSLSGCTSAGLFGASTFGNTSAKIADLSGSQPTTTAGALSEARGHFRNNNFGYSAAFYQRAVELSPNDPEGYVGLGASYDRLGRFDLSDRVYASLYKLSGDTAQYFNNVGYSYMLRGNLTAALTNFRRALSLDPNNALIANNIQILTSTAARA